MYSVIGAKEGEVLYDSGLTLADVTPEQGASVENTVHLKTGFWKAFNRLSDGDADVITLLMSGYRFRDIENLVHNARYRIRKAKKRFRKELGREEINV